MIPPRFQRVSPLIAAALFCGSVLAATALSSTFSLSPTAEWGVALLPLPFLTLMAVVVWRQWARAEEAEREFLGHAVLRAAALTLALLLLAELAARAGSPLWQPREAWPYFVLAGLWFGYRTAR